MTNYDRQGQPSGNWYQQLLADTLFTRYWTEVLQNHNSNRMETTPMAPTPKTDRKEVIFMTDKGGLEAHEAMRPIVAHWSQVWGKRVIVENHHNKPGIPLPEWDNETVYILFWAKHPEIRQESIRYRSSFFGFSIFSSGQCDGYKFDPDNSLGSPIYYSSTEFGRVVGNIIFCHFDLPHMNLGDLPNDAVKKGFNLFLEASSPFILKLKPLVQADLEAEMVKKFTKSLNWKIQNELTNATANQKAFSESSISYLKAYIEAESKLRSFNRTISLYKEKKITEETAAKQIQAIKTLSFVEKFEVKASGAFEVTTKPVIIYHGKKKFKINLGGYKINVLNLDRITITCLKKRTTTSCPHPHIANSGAPCWGNMAEGIATALNEGEFAVLLTLTWNWLHSVTPGEWYSAIEYFMTPTQRKKYEDGEEYNEEEEIREMEREMSTVGEEVAGETPTVRIGDAVSPRF